MLSDEERQAIKFLEKLKDLKIILSCSFWNNGEFEFNNIQKEQFDIILGLIEKQSKEIEELKEKNRQGKMRIVQLENEITARIEDVNQYYTPNDKIKAKIEEINKEMLNEENSLELFYRKKYCKDVLQSLLEKE